jgi:hypothetical protein
VARARDLNGRIGAKVDAQLARPGAWLREHPSVVGAANVAGHVVALAVTTIVFLTLNKRFFYAPIAYDEEFFSWGGWSITKGLAPYRDFIEFKPPLVFITHALAQALFGFENGGYRIFFTLFPLASILVLQTSLVLRGIGRFLAMTAVLALVFLFVNPTWHDTALTDSESIGLCYFMLGFACLLWEGRYAKATTILGGFFMACCAMSKEPFSPMVVTTWLTMFWLRDGSEPSAKTSKHRLFYARYSLYGVGALVLLLCIYMVPTGAMKAYIAMVRSYRAIYRDPAKSYCVVLGLAHPTGTWLGDQAVAWAKTRTYFVNEVTLGSWTLLVIPGAIYALRRSKALFFMMFLVAVAALWAPTATNCQWVHYYNMTMAGLLVVMVAGLDSIKGALAAADPLIRRAGTASALLLVLLHWQPNLSREWSAHYRRPTWHEPVPGILKFIKDHTKPTDRIFTTGPPVLYPQADRVSAVRETNIIDEILGSYEGKTDEEKLRPIYQQLAKNKPVVVVLDPENASRKRRHMKSLIIPFLTDFKYKRIDEYIYLRP